MDLHRSSTILLSSGPPPALRAPPPWPVPPIEKCFLQGHWCVHAPEVSSMKWKGISMKHWGETPPYTCQASSPSDPWSGALSDAAPTLIPDPTAAAESHLHRLHGAGQSISGELPTPPPPCWPGNIHSAGSCVPGCSTVPSWSGGGAQFLGSAGPRGSCFGCHNNGWDSSPSLALR